MANFLSGAPTVIGLPALAATLASTVTVSTGTSTALSPTISGGIAPYTLSLKSGTLPAGRSIVGNSVTGTYTTAGSYAYTLTVTDILGRSVNLPVAVTVSAPALATLSLSTNSATVNAAFSATISGQTAGSTVVATSSDGTVLTVSGANVSGTFTAAGSPNITLTETLAGASNSPKSTSISIALVAVQRAMAYGATNTQVTNIYSNQGSQNNAISELRHTRPFDIKKNDVVELVIPLYTTPSTGVSAVTGSGVYPGAIIANTAIIDPLNLAVSVSPTWIAQQNKSSLTWTRATVSATDGGGTKFSYLPANFNPARPFVVFNWTATQDIPANTPFGVRTFSQFPTSPSRYITRISQNNNGMGRFDGYVSSTTDLIAIDDSGTFTPTTGLPTTLAGQTFPMGVGMIGAPAPIGSAQVFIHGNSIESDNGALFGAGATDVSGGFGDIGGNLKGDRSYATLTFSAAGALHNQFSRGSMSELYKCPPQFVATIAPINGGTATGATLGAAATAGATTLTLGATGSGTLTTSDVIVLPNDATAYQVTSAVSNVAGGGTVTISPGLKAAQASGAAITTAKSLMTVSTILLGVIFANVPSAAITTTVANQTVIGQLSGSVGTTGVFALSQSETVSTATKFVSATSNMTYDLVLMQYAANNSSQMKLAYAMEQDTNEVSKTQFPGASQWQSSRFYYRDQTVYNGGYVYKAQADGTTSTTGPSGTGLTITDGSVKWDCVGVDDGSTGGMRTASGIIAQRTSWLRTVRNYLPTNIKCIDATTPPGSVSCNLATTGYSYNSSTGILTAQVANTSDLYKGNDISGSFSGGTQASGFAITNTNRKQITNVVANTSVDIFFGNMSFTGSITGNTLTVTAVNYAAAGAQFAQNNYLYGPNIPDGTRITSTNVGGVGTYTLNNTFATPVSSQSMWSAAYTSANLAIVNGLTLTLVTGATSVAGQTQPTTGNYYPAGTSVVAALDNFKRNCGVAPSNNVYSATPALLMELSDGYSSSRESNAFKVFTDVNSLSGVSQPTAFACSVDLAHGTARSATTTANAIATPAFIAALNS